MRAGAGFDTIDFVYCSHKGIYVANCPGKNANAVSELAIGLMLSIDRRTAEGITLLKAGHWKKSMFTNCRGIKGQTLGLIGFGNIGKLVCKAARALEMHVLVHTRTRVSGLDEELDFRYVDLDELLALSDIVSIHCPKTADTVNMVNAAFLDKMKNDAILINTSRGDLIDEAALLAKLEACPNFWVGTDVFVGEPTVGEQEGWNHALAQHPRVYGTHHCGASTQQAEGAIGEEAVRVIKKFNSEGVCDKFNWVNPATINDAHLNKVQVRHLDKVGVLAHCFRIFASAGWNVQEFENIVFKQRQACVANLRFEGDASKIPEVKAELLTHPDILSVTFQ